MTRRLFIALLSVFLCLSPTLVIARAGGVVSTGGSGAKASYVPHSTPMRTARSANRFKPEQFILAPWLPLYKFIGLDLGKYGSRFVNTYVKYFARKLIIADIYLLILIAFIFGSESGVVVYFLPIIGLVFPVAAMYCMTPYLASDYHAALFDLSVVVGIDVVLKLGLLLALIRLCVHSNTVSQFINYKAADIQWEKWVRKAYTSLQQAISSRDIRYSEDVLGEALRKAHSATIDTHKSQGTVNVIDSIFIRAVYFLKGDDNEKHFRVTADMRDYILDSKGKIISGSRETVRVEDTLVVRSSDDGKWYVDDIIPG